MHPHIKRRQEHGFVEGDKVYYHSRIGGPHDGVIRTIEVLGELSDIPVAWLSNKRGCVAVCALSSAVSSPSKEQP